MTESTMTDSDVKRAYFAHLRTDVLALVPDGARSFLSVGCGAGRTEAELVKQGCSVTGIEMDSNAAEIARANGLEIFEGDIAQFDGQLAGRAFDCVICADILEHLPDPASVLRECVALLRPGGSVVVSVPNFRHYSIFAALFLRGHCEYVDAGILDRTHLRITTRKMAEQWFRDVGLTADVVRYRLQRRRDKYVSAATFGLFREFLSPQVLLRGIKP